MNKQFYKNGIGWGLGLWAIGYALGIILFMFVPPAMLGWVIMPIGILITLWVLWKKVPVGSFQRDLSLSITWTLLAVVCDYLFLLQLLKPADGYYKMDVYLYYALTFLLPLIVGRYRRQQRNTTIS